VKTHTIEVDELIAAGLQKRAAERGMSVSQLLADLLALDSQPIAIDSEEVAELDRRWEAAKRDNATVGNEDVVRWLGTWGTPEFRRWQDK
jgi:predicted transcriptional regulator